MVPEALDLIDSLALDRPEKPPLAPVERAREHEILPHQKALLVTEVVEHVGLVHPASPAANAVEVGLHGRAQKVVVVLAGHCGHQVVGGDPTRALGEKRKAVHLELERLAPAVVVTVELDRSEADTVRPDVDHRPAVQKLHGERVERLASQTVGPPQAGIGHGERESFGFIDARPVDLDACAVRDTGEAPGRQLHPARKIDRAAPVFLDNRH
jgi:hypothetical protein